MNDFLRHDWAGVVIATYPEQTAGVVTLDGTTPLLDWNNSKGLFGLGSYLKLTAILKLLSMDGLLPSLEGGTMNPDMS